MITTIADSKYWKIPAENKRREINIIKQKLMDSGIKPLPPYQQSISLNLNHGSWQQAYWKNIAEFKWWQEVEQNPWNKFPIEQLISMISDDERQAMKNTAHSWLQDIIDSTNAEAGKTNEYNNEEVPRAKGKNYHQRGHYFIFYEGDTPQNPQREHWLALYPPFNDSELCDGHSHKVFILEFDKPVRKFFDVYTCIGCGAVGQGYTALHKDYDIGQDISQTNPSDSWEIIHKGRPFEPWFSEFSNPVVIPPLTAWNKIMTPRGRCMGSNPDVWQGWEIRDFKNNKTFEKAYGYISHGGTIQWRLARKLENEAEWIKKRVPYHMDKLWGKNEFTDYADRNTAQQMAMNMTINELLQQREYIVEYLRDKHNTNNINKQLEQELQKRFQKLIRAKREIYLNLERWIKEYLNGIDSIEEAVNTVPELNEQKIIRMLWNQQIERFIKEGKAREFFAEHLGSKMAYNRFEIDINSLYQRLFDKLGFNQRVENVQQLEQVAQIVIK